MSTKGKKKRFLLIFLAVFLVLFLGSSVTASAAWKKNSNGTYSYYQNGKKQKNKWIDQEYYVNSKGVRQTGWLYKNKKWYYFSKSGRVVRGSWIKSKGKMYYAGKNGALLVNGRHKVGSHYYAFSKRGVRLTGRRTYGGKTYYFGKKTGRMLVSQWVTENKKSSFFGPDGVMVKSKWVGRYYVDKNGVRLKNTWKDGRYLGSSGKAYVGLAEIGSYYYYFDSKTYKRVTNATITIDGDVYQFDSKGRGKLLNEKKPPKTKVNVEKTYYSDHYVSDEKLLAALIYCEAGNQSYTGKLAVGLVIMNRVNSSLFPSKLREVVYQKKQFAPARDGSLTRTLKNLQRIDADSEKAAAEVIKRMKTYTKGTPVKLKISGKNVTFPYLFFMTKPAYDRLGLHTKYRKIGDHVFFTKWG